MIISSISILMRSFSPLLYDFTLLIIIIIIIMFSILGVLFRRFFASIIRDFESRLRQKAKSEFVPRD